MGNYDQKEFYAVVLGALLHDIGSLILRASEKQTGDAHTQIGADWFKKILKEKLSPILGDKNVGIVESAIINHHENEIFITLADRVATGKDDLVIDDEEKELVSNNRLSSILSEISITERPKTRKFHHIEWLGKNSLQEVFPCDENTGHWKDYHGLLVEFEKEISTLDFKQLSVSSLIDTFYFLLLKYTWCVPNPLSMDEPDVSLFDHLQITAALAACLYLYKEQNMDNTIDSNTNAFQLIAGDVSGIQQYIFKVLNQQGKAAKRLRARSLFVQMLSDIASHKILHALDLSLCNIIMSAGGNFLILAPNIIETEKALSDLQHEFDDWTFQNLNGEIFISLSSIRLSGKELKNFSEAVDSVKSQLNEKKYRPYSSILENNGKWDQGIFLLPEIIEGEEKICQSCRQHPAVATGLNEENLCRRCSEDAEIGKRLPRSSYIAFFSDETHAFKVLNYSFELCNEAKPVRDGYLNLHLNNTELTQTVRGFKFLPTYIPAHTDVGGDQSEKQRQPLTFDEIANRSEGDKLLGYLKGDVDNLGLILREGFSTRKSTMARTAMFARVLDTFFSGYLYMKTASDFKDMYIVFSGGDDFFVIGPWNKCIDFAQALRKDFSEFCGGNPDLTFSAGIFLAKPHDPISFCSKLADQRLEYSKEQKGKDKVTLFNHTITWDETGIILREVAKITEWFKQEPPVIQRNLVYRLREYGEMAHYSNIFGKDVPINTKYLKFVPLLIYDINRNLAKENQSEAYQWAINLVPCTSKPAGGNLLPYLDSIMEYVLTYTRSYK